MVANKGLASEKVTSYKLSTHILRCLFSTVRKDTSTASHFATFFAVFDLASFAVLMQGQHQNKQNAIITVRVVGWMQLDAHSKKIRLQKASLNLLANYCKLT